MYTRSEKYVKLDEEFRNEEDNEYITSTSITNRCYNTQEIGPGFVESHRIFTFCIVIRIARQSP